MMRIYKMKVRQLLTHYRTKSESFLSRSDFDDSMRAIVDRKTLRIGTQWCMRPEDSSRLICSDYTPAPVPSSVLDTSVYTVTSASIGVDPLVHSDIFGTIALKFLSKHNVVSTLSSIPLRICSFMV